MFGFITPNLNALDEQGKRVFRSFYCGLCRILGDRHGFVARLGLNYDFTFLAILHASLTDAPDIQTHHCVYNPFVKKPFANSSALHRAADDCVLLTALKLDDDNRDAPSFKSRVGSILYRPILHHIQKSDENRLLQTQALLQDLYQLEAEECPLLDQVADLFGQIMQLFFDLPSAAPTTREQLRHLGYHCGRVIYLLDAVSDLKEDFDRNEYNPLMARFSLQTPADFAGEPAARIRRNFLYSFTEMGEALAALPVGEWAKPVLENIIYLGLRGRMDEELKIYE